ncbi:Hypothetical predicted protein [Pelobates cultripes]|uniref:Uncharacterized protein n=1 Tax=Pelobates cultripes TaxID=61616 RepID=A0AAD1RYC1_PELCU|nr:Hypothetical predicted protein [Pelobates cultripes]
MARNTTRHSDPADSKMVEALTHAPRGTLHPPTEKPSYLSGSTTSLKAIFARFWAKLRAHMATPTSSSATPAKQNRKKVQGRPPLGNHIEHTPVSPKEHPPWTEGHKGLAQETLPTQAKACRYHTIRTSRNPTPRKDSQSPQVCGLVVLATTRIQGWKDATPGHCPTVLSPVMRLRVKDSPPKPLCGVGLKLPQGYHADWHYRVIQLLACTDISAEASSGI